MVRYHADLGTGHIASILVFTRFSISFVHRDSRRRKGIQSSTSTNKSLAGDRPFMPREKRYPNLMHSGYVCMYKVPRGFLESAASFLLRPSQPWLPA
ncbi:hypothetical protein BDV33DRAFT_120912 [Aspergillus novoparasiticus]|uniref:Uncharacterized protein n=1 Tax=Aspergillus novoparasiticus TaxID=986946 RepID=A0A5N6ELY0_9EURO|nr:hypothetical protein BDV33DRAFT_120912 [Aspergillus novoparasiticus]